MDMKSTAVNERLAADFKDTQVMKMTGHKSLASIRPYVVQNMILQIKLLLEEKKFQAKKRYKVF